MRTSNGVFDVHQHGSAGTSGSASHGIAITSPSAVHMLAGTIGMSPHSDGSAAGATSPGLAQQQPQQQHPTVQTPADGPTQGANSSSKGKGKQSVHPSRRNSEHSPAGDEEDRKRPKAGPRASVACSVCRKRKIRCSGGWPKCSFCEFRKFECKYEGHPAETAHTVGNPHALYGIANSFPVGATSLPAQELVLEALDVFLLHNYDTFYFIHKPTLVESIKAETAPKELLFCILAFAARFMQSLKDLHENSPLSAADTYAAIAALLLATAPSSATVRANGTTLGSLDSDVTLVRCQCFLMLGVFECTANLENAGWLRIGQAFRMAQILRLGFEDEDEGTSSSRPEKDPLRSEARRRTFWACFLIDRTMSDGKERPCVLRVPLPSVLRLPSSDAYYHTGTYAPGARFDPDPPPWSLPHHGEQGAREPEPDLYGMTLRVSEVFQKVSTYIGAGGRNVDRRAPWVPESTFATLRAELAMFESRLPKDFQYNDSNFTAHCLIGQGRLYAMLHLLYNTATLILHRDYLPFLPPPNFKAGDGPIDGEPLYGEPLAPAGWWQASFNRAAIAAGSVADILSMSISHGSMISHPFAGFAALASTTIHLHLKYWPQSSDAPVNNAFHIEQTAATLTQLRDVYPIASGWCDGMAKLQVLYFGRVRGKIDIDPAKVRSSVVNLLQSSRDNNDSANNRAANSSNETPSATARHARKTKSKKLNAATELSPGEHIVSNSSLASVITSPTSHNTTPLSVTSQPHAMSLPAHAGNSAVNEVALTTSPGASQGGPSPDSNLLDFGLFGMSSQPYNWSTSLDPLVDMFGNASGGGGGGWADFNVLATMDPFGPGSHGGMDSAGGGGNVASGSAAALAWPTQNFQWQP
ncbi:hypothetical protein OIV83_001433 [Microbotryomycetes sp. JL201]|nr:hypothetical protein OIV83_001433 [Microbotryomycetes sp. JL201]